ncbi:MAG: LysM peptidoglycan-binding domain-containing protein [Deltaproteobacteria bacterium]|nr:LysM peptidoglycan-binding domain-containing protein [Deltaproteobacteria bacterium]
MAAVLLCVFISACAKGRVEEYPSLANQGILPLSTTNAFVGSNLFIANEAERSPYLYNFLKAKGGPLAIEIIEPKFGAARILMFYPHEREVYAADIQEREYSRQWIIRGPYGIDRKDYRKLGSLDSSMSGAPLFFIRGKLERFKYEEQPEQPVQVLQPVVPTPVPAKPTPKKKVVKKTEVKKAESPGEFKPLNSDQQAIQMSMGYAERASNGDVVHTVKSDTETLESIAKWYTGSTTNAEQLAKANALGAKDPLAIGTRISIPVTLVRNFKIMGSSK